MSEEKSKAYEITKQVEITLELREKLRKLYRKRGARDRLIELERCMYISITVGVLTNVKDKDDLKKKLYRLIEYEDRKPHYERDYEFYNGFEETSRHGLEVKCYSKTGNWMQVNAEEINLIEV